MNKKIILFLIIIILLMGIAHANSLSDKLKQKYGKDWSLEIGEKNGYNRRMIGYNVDVRNKIDDETNKMMGNSLMPIDSSAKEQAIDKILRDFIRTNLDILAVDESNMEKVNFEYDKLANKESSGNWYLHYQQTYHGIPVYNSFVNVITVNDKIVSVSSNFYQNINISETPILSKEQALDLVKHDLNNINIEPINISLLIYTDESEIQPIYHLSWYFLLDGWRYFIDANDGSILYKETTIKDADLTGAVKGMVYIPNSNSPQTLVNISSLNVTVNNSGNRVLYNITNGLGFYNISGINGNATLTSYLEGPYVKVFNGTRNSAKHTFIASTTQSTFTNGRNSENLTFTVNGNITRLLNITQNTRIASAQITLNGFNSTIYTSVNATENSEELYNITGVSGSAYDFRINASRANFSCTNYTFSIFNYASGSWCNFAQNLVVQQCTGSLGATFFDLANTSCNQYSDYLSDGKVQLNLSGVQNLEYVNLTYSLKNLSSPKNLTLYINGSQAYFNSSFNNVSVINLDVSLLQNVLDACYDSSAGNCTINVTFSNSVDGNNSMLEYSNLSIIYIVPVHDFNWSSIDYSFGNEQTNAFYHVNWVHDFFTKGTPFDVTGMNYQIKAVTEALDACNANFDSSDQSLNFGKNGYCDSNIVLDSSVIYHEYTHAVVDVIYSTFPYSGQTGAMNEGFADFWAAAINNDSKIGKSSFSSGGGDSTCSDCLRNLNNSINMPSLWSEVHDDSRSFSGALWDTRLLLSSSEAESLIMQAMKAQPHSFAETLEDILIFNDNNTNLADGTPNSSLICLAFFTNHGIQSPFCNSSISGYQLNDSITSKFFDAVAGGKIVNGSESTDGVKGMDDDDITIPIDMGFNFSFFNSNYSSIYIGSDGIVFFENYIIDYFNDFPTVLPIPDTSAPNNFISVYRHDLNPNETSNSGGGDVYYWKDIKNNRFIVEWFQIRPFEEIYNETFELILYKDGRIIFQYLNITNNTVIDVTIGLESAGGKFGITYMNVSTTDDIEPFGICFLPIGSSTNCINAPSIINLTINSNNFYTVNGPINGTFNVSNPDGNKISNETRWYNNSVEALNFRNTTIINSSNLKVGQNWTFSTRIFDEFNWSEWVNSSAIMITNRAPVLNAIPNITASESDLVNINATGNVTATDADGDNILFTYSAPLNSSGQWQTGYNDARNYTITVTANDSNGGIATQTVLITVLDKVNGANDTIIGNLSDIATNVPNLNLIISNVTFNSSLNFTGTNKINFTENNNTIIEFDYDFSNTSKFNFVGVRINSTLQNGSQSIIISGIDLTSQGKTKTIYMNRTNETYNSVCIKDAEISSIDQMTVDCSASGETKLSCDGSSTGGFTCTLQDTVYKITGLSHSGIRQITYTPSGGGNNGGSSSSSSGGGGGGGGGGGATGFICNHEWQCSDWSLCASGWQTRECNFAKVPQHVQEAECPDEAKIPATTKTCEVKKEISNLAASVNESKKSSGIASQSSNNKINSTQQAKTGLGAITGRFATIMKGTGVWIAVTFTIAAIILGIFIFTSYKNKKNGINKR